MSKLHIMHTKGTKRILNILHILAWVIFSGLCFKAGAIVCTSFASLFIDPEKLYKWMDLTSLMKFGTGHYITFALLLAFISGLKAHIFYLIIMIFNKINFVNPFSRDVFWLILRISYVTVGVGVFTLLISGYCKWLMEKGVDASLSQTFSGGDGEFLLLGGVMYMIAQVFKRGIEIQSENDLTV